MITPKKQTEPLTKKTTLAIFDIDGTIAENGKNVTPEMLELIGKLRSKVTVALIGGSSYYIMKSKLSGDPSTRADYIFAENGLVAWKEGKQVGEAKIAEFLDNKKLTKMINWCLTYIVKLDLPVKRGTFIDFRTGLINISP